MALAVGTLFLHSPPGNPSLNVFYALYLFVGIDYNNAD